MKNVSFKKFIIFIVIMLLVLVFSVVLCTQYASRRMKAVSFQRLEEMTEDLARDFQVQINTNFSMLHTMSLAFSMTDFSDNETLTDILNAYDEQGSSYMHLQLLTSDGRMLKQNGEWVDVSAYIDFEQEAARAPMLSGRRPDLFSADTLIMYETVPVIQNNEPIAVLYCTIDLQEMSDQYTVTDFSGDAIVMLIDGATGDVLIDTWHKSLGNLADFVDRDFKMGDTIREAIVKMSQNESGDMAFTSKTANEVLYLHYEPVGIGQLSATIGVKANTALKDTMEIAAGLYTMSAIIFIVLSLITLVTTLFLLRINRNIYMLSTTDRHTGLLNRSSYEAFLAEHSNAVYAAAACIYLDVNGLHELNNTQGHAAGDAMLLAIADAMRKQWPHTDIYRVGGDEFVLFPHTTDTTKCLLAIRQLQETLHRQDYSVSVGFARLENETGLDRVIKLADEDMLKNKAEYYKTHNRRRRE